MAETVLAKMAVQIAANTAQFNQGLKSAQTQFSGFTSNITNLAKGLVAGFGFLEIAKGVIRVTSEFQKFEAILTNTLGSQSAAQKALSDIQQFAATTPFEVDELTAAYVRWANQGLSPTIDRLGKLGDIASSLGAGFEQTAEAFKDLMVGQTKRIEEIGISATQANGKIQLSFKGVNLEIEKNAEGVQKALDVYSQLNGVLGTSDAISLTLGGRISNLSDAYSNLLRVIGEGNSGVLFEAVTSLTRIVNTLAHVKQELEIDKAVVGMKDFRDLSKQSLDYILDLLRANNGQSIADILKPLTDQSNEQFFANFEANSAIFRKSLEDAGESMEVIIPLYKRYVERRLEATKAEQDAAKNNRLNEVLKARADAIKEFDKLSTASNKAQLTGLNALRAALRELNSEFDKTNENDTTRLNSISQEITALSTLISKLEDLKKARSEAPLTSNTRGSAVAPLPGLTKDQTAEIIANLTLVGSTNAEVTTDVSQRWIDMGKVMQDVALILEQNLEGLSVNIGKVLGSLAIGKGSFSDFGRVILGSLGKTLTQLGEMLIATGIGIKAFQESLKSLNPYVAIAAGIALVALGSAISGGIRGLGSSGGGGSSSGSSGSTKLNEIHYVNRDLRVYVEGRLEASGKSLVAIIKNENRANDRILG